MSASMIEFPVNTHDNMVPVQHVPRSATTSHIDEVGYQPGVNPAIHESEPVSEEDIHAESVQPAMAYVIGLHAYFNVILTIYLLNFYNRFVLF
jgi:hypothetical protein